MKEKRFRARKHWQNTAAWALMSLFVMIAVLMWVAVSGDFMLLAIVAALVAFGFGVALIRDRLKRCLYLVDDEVLELHGGGHVLAVKIVDVQDASLVDRAAARDYVQQKLRAGAATGISKKDLRELKRGFVRYCSVDIGLRSFSFGLGRRMIDRMPDARHDLVLLRLRNGIDHLLSPVYNQDLVSSISRSMRARERA